MSVSSAFSMSYGVLIWFFGELQLGADKNQKNKAVF
jgi:hypothetical protein